MFFNRYVQGTQNPRKDPVPSGSVVMNTYLTDGSYDVRYEVNKQFVNVVNTSKSKRSSKVFQKYANNLHALTIGECQKLCVCSKCVFKIGMQF